MPAGGDADLKVSEHLDSGCTRHIVQTLDKTGKVKKKRPRVCTMKKCKAKSAPVRCRKCHNMFCIKHRHPDMHKCASLQPTKSTASEHPLLQKFRGAVFGSAGKPEPKPKAKKKKRTNTKAAALIKMRKLKDTSVGDKRIGMSDRCYLEVKFAPEVADVKDVSIFLNKKHPVGRCLDDICKAGGVVNRNNDPTAQKIGILSKFGGFLPMDIPLHLLEPQLSSGDTVTISYVL